MLKLLRICNLATIDRLEVDFKEGLNVLTGETGTGKSIIIDALGMLVGGKTKIDIVRTGERATFIEGVFGLGKLCDARVNKLLASAGAQKSVGNEIFLRREIHSNGRNRMFVNDQMVTLGLMRAIQPQLLEIHGQGGQRDLTEATTHLGMLDAFAKTTALKTQVTQAFLNLKSAKNKLQILESRLAEKERNLDFLRFQLSEIISVSPQPKEDEELRVERTLLTNIEQAIALSNMAYQNLFEGDQSVLVNLGAIRRQLQQLAILDARLVDLPEAVETSIITLSEVVETLRSYDARLDFSSERLETVENRLEELERLKRKYGGDLERINQVVEGLNADLEYWNSVDLEGMTLRNEISTAKAAYIPLAAELSELRRAAVLTLESKMAEALVETFTERARFTIQIDSAVNSESGDGLASKPPEFKGPIVEEATPGSEFFSAQGADRVEFLFSANPGETVRPLGRVASGGELSRLMLTLISTVLESESDNAHSSPETVVFDEIDVGIGGRSAERVGHKLKSLAARRQVLCVTHQPQIARFADHHFVLAKHVERGRTATKIQELDFDERVRELARMVGGNEDAEVAREAARWMLGEGIKKGTAARRHKTAPKNP